MIWHVVGAGSALPRVGYGCAGYVLEPEPGGPVTLFDCGPGTVRSLAGLGIELARVERVVLSHFHLDHCLDLFALAFARRNARVPDGPVELVGPTGLEEWVEGAVAVFGSSSAFRAVRYVEVAAQTEPVHVAQGGAFTLYGVATRHTEVALAWRIEHGARALAYSGDAREVEELVRLARGVQLFVCECSAYDEDPMPNHLTPRAAARLAQAAGVERLVLTHFYPHVDPQRARAHAREVFAGAIDCARDGARFEL